MSDNKTVVVPVEPTEKQYEEGKFIAEMMLKTVGKIDISIVYQTMISAAPASLAATAPDPVVEANRELLLQRSQVGIKKYGVTLQDSGLTHDQFLEHALLEVLDLANYLQGAMRNPKVPAASLAQQDERSELAQKSAALLPMVKHHQYGLRGFGDGSLSRGRDLTKDELCTITKALQLAAITAPQDAQERDALQILRDACIAGPSDNLVEAAKSAVILNTKYQDEIEEAKRLSGYADYKAAQTGHHRTFLGYLRDLRALTTAQPADANLRLADKPEAVTATKKGTE